MLPSFVFCGRKKMETPNLKKEDRRPNQRTTMQRLLSYLDQCLNTTLKKNFIFYLRIQRTEASQPTQVNNINFKHTLSLSGVTSRRQVVSRFHLEMVIYVNRTLKYFHQIICRRFGVEKKVFEIILSVLYLLIFLVESIKTESIRKLIFFFSGQKPCTRII